MAGFPPLNAGKGLVEEGPWGHRACTRRGPGNEPAAEYAAAVGRGNE